MSNFSHLSIVGILIIVIVFLSDVIHSQCNQVRLRKSLSQLSQNEWESFKRGLLALKKNGQLDRLTKMHRSGMEYHGTAYFFPMHRALLVDFENELLRVAPGLTGIPYWDELREGSKIGKSDVFTMNRLSPIVRGPLRGTFAGLRDDSQRLVTRDPQNIPSSFNWLPPNAVMTRALERFGNYGDFSRVVEVSPHNQFHVLLGGHMGDPSISPSDPAFWVHHAYIDLIWALWQSLRPQNRENLQAWGTSRPGINPAEPVVLYGKRWTNRDMLFYRSRLCYQYTMPTTKETTFQKRTTTMKKCYKKEQKPIDTPSTMYPTPYFKQMWVAPAEGVAKVMPNMTLSDWRKVESELNQAIDEINLEIASGQVKPEDLPDIQSLFYKSKMDCSVSQSAGDDYRDSLIPEIQQLAAVTEQANLATSSGAKIETFGSYVVIVITVLINCVLSL